MVFSALCCYIKFKLVGSHSLLKTRLDPYTYSSWTTGRCSLKLGVEGYTIGSINSIGINIAQRLSDRKSIKWEDEACDGPSLINILTYSKWSQSCWVAYCGWSCYTGCCLPSNSRTGSRITIIIVGCDLEQSLGFDIGWRNFERQTWLRAGSIF